MGLLEIIYWVLLVLWGLGVIFGPEWPWWPRASWGIVLVLFIIIGIKMLKPNL